MSTTKLVSGLISLILFAFGSVSYGQDGTPQGFRELSMKRSATPITVDGKMDEAAWQAATVAKDFWNKWPSDQELAEAKTEVRMTFDGQYLYLFAVCYQDDNYVIQTLKRDQGFWDSDGFELILDPVKQKTNGFLFGVNALGAQNEGLLTQDTEDYRTDWDNKWFSAVKSFPDRFQIEMAIPFKTLRFEAGKTRWGVNFIRNDMKRNYYSTWSHVPLNFDGIDLGYMGTLIWEEAPTPAKGNVSIIPYVIGRASHDYETQEPTAWKGGAGLDAKIAVSPSLNLDLTVNPDFSQVDVDIQQTNLQRFDLFFPERRTFFLENSDLFNSFGIPPTRPFFSRRIGLDDNTQPIPILFGARLSGNLSKLMRIGLMSMQTAATDDFKSQNYSVAAFQQRVLKRSTINGIVLSRQAFEGLNPLENDYTRNAGLEFNYSSEDGKWISWGQYHGSWTPEKLGENTYYNVGAGVNSRNITHFTSYSHTGTNYLVDIGFNARQFNYDASRDTTVRLGYNILFQEFAYTFYPKNNKTVNQHGPRLESIPIWNPDFTLNEWSLDFEYGINFSNSSNLEVSIERTLVNLPFVTELLGEEFAPLPVGQYDFMTGEFSYNSDGRKAFSVETGLEFGEFYNGKRNTQRLGLNYRRQPWGNFTLNFVRNELVLPDSFGQVTLLLISPKIEVNFSRNLFWTTFLQYNTQADNFNINSRLQWRFKPMSDLFVVYSDNYAVEQFGVKNRGIVVKLNYWLTL